MENKWKELIEKAKEKSKLPKKNQLLILFLVGILLVVIVFPTSPKPEDEDYEGMNTGNVNSGTGVSISEEAYEQYLETRVARTLEYVQGVGKAEVMITLKSSGQKIVEKDQQSSSQNMDETDSTGGTRNTEDQSSDRTSIYKQDADGSSIPYVSKEMTPEVEGVIVIAQGGDNAVVVQNITEAIQALFSVEVHKIKIMKRTDT